MKSNKIKDGPAKSILKNDGSADLISNASNNNCKVKTGVRKREKKRLGTKEEQKELDKMRLPTAVIKQIKKSELDLTSYTIEGSQLVTNVLLANDNRENNRRCTDKNERDVRLKAVELESEIATAKFMEISDQWQIILKKNDALEIHEHSELQKKRGLDLIEQKNQMIEILKRDLAESDTRFLDEQAAQSEDVRILQERIENQVKFIRKQYKNHVQCIKSTMDQQREYRIDNANERWKTNYNETVLIESNSLNDRLAMIEKKENNIMKQYEMNEETIRNLKSNINTELHDMQREFELIKLKCLENVEKLNYNYQVLKRREEENASAKAAQRRKINKLQDILSNKRKILRETKTEFKAKVPLLQDEIEKLKQDVDRHEKKAERFAEIQEKTFKELWDFSQKQITTQLERIFKIDQIIYETQLGIDWHPPDKLKYLDVSELPSFRKKPSTPNAENLRVENGQRPVDSYAETRERTMLRLMYDSTVRNASFIVDNELIEIVKSHPKKDLLLLYNAMAAYGLNTMDSWRYLLSCAQSMVTCAVCRGPVLWRKNDFNRPEKVDSERKPEYENKLVDSLLVFTEAHSKYIEKTLCTTTNNTLDKTFSDNCRPTIFEQKTTPLDVIDTAADTNHCRSLERANSDSDNSTITFSLSLTDFEQLCSENESNTAIKSQHSFSQVELEHFQMESEEQNDYSESTSLKGYHNITEEKNVLRLLCDNPEHPLVIKDVDYLRAIKKSISIVKSKGLDQRRKNDSDFYLTKTLNIDDISDYWKQFLYAFPENRLKMWDMFDKAIKKYYQTLHLRFKKTSEVEKLENENMELKKILKQFMDAEQDDVRLQNICTPRIKKKQTDSSKRNPKTTMITNNNSTNILCGTSVHIFTVNRTVKSNKQTLQSSDGIYTMSQNRIIITSKGTTSKFYMKQATEIGLD